MSRISPSSNTHWSSALERGDSPAVCYDVTSSHRYGQSSTGGCQSNVDPFGACECSKTSNYNTTCRCIVEDNEATSKPLKGLFKLPNSSEDDYFLPPVRPMLDDILGARQQLGELASPLGHQHGSAIDITLARMPRRQTRSDLYTPGSNARKRRKITAKIRREQRQTSNSQEALEVDVGQDYLPRRSDVATVNLHVADSLCPISDHGTHYEAPNAVAKRLKILPTTRRPFLERGEDELLGPPDLAFLNERYISRVADRLSAQASNGPQIIEDDLSKNLNFEIRHGQASVWEPSRHKQGRYLDRQSETQCHALEIEKTQTPHVNLLQPLDWYAGTHGNGHGRIVYTPTQRSRDTGLRLSGQLRMEQEDQDLILSDYRHRVGQRSSSLPAPLKQAPLVLTAKNPMNGSTGDVARGCDVWSNIDGVSPYGSHPSLEESTLFVQEYWPVASKQHDFHRLDKALESSKAILEASLK